MGLWWVLVICTGRDASGRRYFADRKRSGSALESILDRLCKTTPAWAAEKCKGAVNGCCGGFPLRALGFVEEMGIPTVEAYGTESYFPPARENVSRSAIHPDTNFTCKGKVAKALKLAAAPAAITGSGDNADGEGPGRNSGARKDGWQRGGPRIHVQNFNVCPVKERIPCATHRLNQSWLRM